MICGMAEFDTQQFPPNRITSYGKNIYFSEFTNLQYIMELHWNSLALVIAHYDFAWASYQ